MSLINEALKKAQTDRPSVNPNVPPPPTNPGVPPQQPQPSPNRRRYLWGFILSILIVGLFTTTLSTFLIYQILGEEEKKADKSGQSRLETVSENVGELAEVVETATSTEDSLAPSPETAVSPVPVTSEQATATEQVVSKPEVAKAAPTQVAAQTPLPPPQQVKAPEPVSQAQPQPQPAAVEQVASQAPASTPQAQAQPAAQQVTAAVALAAEPVAAPQVVAAPPAPVENPAIWGRLQNIEIRGIMSGGTKVMIFDADNNKTKTYRPGDLFDGTLSLKVAEISPAAIIFEDHGGFRYTKSF
jgi:hypothetical protein